MKGREGKKRKPETVCIGTESTIKETNLCEGISVIYFYFAALYECFDTVFYLHCKYKFFK